MTNWLQHATTRSRGAAIGAGVLAVLAWLPAAAAPAAAIEARYKAERAACESGNTGEDRATCLREAAAARDEARRGQLDNGADQYQLNARARCDRLRGDEARDCLSRVRGEGEVSGSVRGGGVLRETRTLVVGPVPAASVPMR